MPHAPVAIAVAVTLFLAGCSTHDAGAQEHPAMKSTDIKSIFPDPSLEKMARAIAEGDRAEILALAPHTNLAGHGDSNVTLLEWAIYSRSTEALAALLDAGADPTEQGIDNDTVVHMAATVNDAKYLKVLIDHKAPIDTPNPSGRTPLFDAVLHKRGEQASMLIAAGADVHHRDRMGDSLLHVAAVGNNSDDVLRFLKLGVDPRLVNAQHVTFQPGFFTTPEKILNAKAKEGRASVREWLKAHAIPVEG
ncbi:ankyrin repeat domain-containing protein [Pseudoxanthomonas sp.]|uniref:ankyrin repeat domain-containing protein n=1 Tax=Pseudoxanthomonas sp. TaxID=1871049 RepID=UPI0026101CD6|nr:ankyrin repeat domain-containing protein [Pseudoxanthomonas sp.]WDS36363.1 MAG: ankyrin repeat domain-containing protein [Pseudoxanthomonas sp.]